MYIADFNVDSMKMVMADMQRRLAAASLVATNNQLFLGRSLVPGHFFFFTQMYHQYIFRFVINLTIGINII